MVQQKKVQIAKVLKNGGVVVMPSDTIYGVFVSALDPVAVERLYSIRKRSKEKPCIILCSNINEVKFFTKRLSENKINRLKELWKKNKTNNTPITIILKAKKDFEYLHRGKQTLAFRIPNTQTKRSVALLSLLKETGPLLAPSANLAGHQPATTLTQAKKYFATSIDLYVSHGRKLESTPSQIFDFTNDILKRIR